MLTLDEETGTDFMTQYIWLSSILMIFSLCSLGLQVNYLKQINNQYNKIRSKMKVKADKKAYKAYKKKLQSLNKNNRLNKGIVSFTNNWLLLVKNKAKKAGINYEESVKLQRELELSADLSNTISGTDTMTKRLTVSSSKTSTEIDSLIVSEELDWSQLTYSDKLKLLNGWTFIVIIGDILQIVGCIFFITTNEYSYERSGPLLGFAAFFHWCAILKYISRLNAYNIVAATLANSWLLVCKSVLGILPLLFGFVLFGMCIFVQSNRFNTIPVSFYSLYALMNGDSIFDIYFEIIQLDFLFGSIFMYVFIFAAICIIQNTFVVIVGDAYANFQVKLTQDEYGGQQNYAELYAEDPLAPFYDISEKEIRSKNALYKMLQLDKDGIMRDYKEKKREIKKINSDINDEM